MAVSKAQIKAVRKYEAENLDILRGRFPKGTKELIQSLGYTVNAFLVEAVNEKLNNMGKDVK